MKGNLYEVIHKMGISDKVISIAEEAEKKTEDVRKSIDRTSEINQYKVIRAMQENRLSESDFSATTGYGYDDRGRDRLDRIYADVFKSESAIVRHSIVAGTHALATAMFGNLRPGDRLVSVTGTPYDTLAQVIGTGGKGWGSLSEFGVEYAQADLPEGEGAAMERLENCLTENTRMVLIQRSMGYSWRKSISIEEIADMVSYIKKIKSDIIVLVDNCYGEFAEEKEPIEAGADLVAGSLIKNPGGGVAPSGGYIAGRADLVENAACRLTAPGLGSRVGASLGHSRLIAQGLFMAPHAVSESLKGAVLCSAIMERLGFETRPGTCEKRPDIIQAVKFNSREGLIAFCRGIQAGSPVDAYITPEPWEMPGYNCPVIMAAGGFIQGSSIELSADGPVKSPYIAYLQGGLIYGCVKLGIMKAVQHLIEQGITDGD